MNTHIKADASDNAHSVSKPFERTGEPGVWAVEEIGSDGEIYQAIFVGPDAECRCEAYWAFKYGA